MKMKRTLVVVTVVVLCVALPCLAKRMPPKPVAPVTKDGIQYSAPLDHMGFVVATWLKTGREIWSRQIYVVKYEYQYGLEEDVQWCFITKIKFAGDKLRITNERGSEFELDPHTLEVKTLKGGAVIDHTNRKPPGR